MPPLVEKSAEQGWAEIPDFRGARCETASMQSFGATTASDIQALSGLVKSGS